MTVTAAASGREAIALLEQGTAFNLLLTDVMMPDVDGPTLLHYVRNAPFYQELPVVMMSSNEHADVVLNCIRLGAEDYLLKPVTKKAVKHMWAHVWRRKQRYQMVPRFENGEEIMDGDELDHRIRMQNELEMGTALPVPSTEEYSSDGASEELMDDARKDYYAAEYLREEEQFERSSGGAGPSSIMGRVGGSCPVSHGENVGQRGGEGGKRVRHRVKRPPSAFTLGGECPFAGVQGKKMEKVDEDAEMNAMDAEPRDEMDPLLIEDAATGTMRRLRPVSSIEGLSVARTTLREWMDKVNAQYRVKKCDRLHVLKQTASLLASHHERGLLLGAMRPSTLMVSPQGDVTLAPPRPATPPRYAMCKRDASSDADTDDDDDDDRMHRAGARWEAEPHEKGSATAVMGEFAKDMLYVSPEEHTGSSRGAPAECFGLGMLMVELCWPDIVHSTCGDIRKLLTAMLKPDGAGAAALAADATESRIAQQLLHPVPGNRPTAKQALELLTAAAAEDQACSVAAPAAGVPGGDSTEGSEGWATVRDMGLAVERRREELIALAGFLLASREARVKEAQGHRVRSALLAHALRQLGNATVEAVDGLRGQQRLSARVASGARAGAALESGRTGGGERLNLPRRTMSFDLPRRASHIQQLGGLAQQEDVYPQEESEQPSKRRRAGIDGGSTAAVEPRERKGLEGAASPQRRSGSFERHRSSFERHRLSFEGERRSSLETHRRSFSKEMSPLRRSSLEVRRTVSRNGSFDEGPRGTSEDRPLGPLRQPSLDRIRNRSALMSKSFSASDLSVLDPTSAAAIAAAAGHRPASDLNTEAFNALEETFFDACARAIAPIARNYTRATAAAADQPASDVPSQDNEAPPPTADSVAEQQQQSKQLELQRRNAAAAEAAGAAGAALECALESFGSDLAQCMRRTQLRITADLSLGDVHSFGEMICSTGWDRDGEYIATAGISKRLRVFEVDAVASVGAAVHYPVAEMKTNSKLSALVWNPYIKHRIATADYDGSIHMWDVNRGEMIDQQSEHKKRVWSLDFSTLDPTRLLSGSDDGTVRVWSTQQRNAPLIIHNKANVCSVQFSPVNANVITFGSADYKIYAYDLRHTMRPLVTLAGHKKAVSYVRWLGAEQIVSASTDNTLKLWDVKRGMLNNIRHGVKSSATMLNSATNSACVRTFTGHINQKNFVGMSVAANGHIACGSEDNTVCLYARGVPTPIAKQSLAMTATQHASRGLGMNGGTGDAAGAGRSGGDEKQPGLFVSSVSWSPDGQRLVATNSWGAVKMLEVTTLSAHT